MFGAAVNDFGSRAISSIGRGILGATVGDADGQSSFAPFAGAWQSTKYAADLIKYAPKHRFMFKVQFQFNQTYASMQGGRDPNAFSYLVKMIDRPKVEFSYEDVNYYNFRTKVLKEIRHEPLSLTFIDDIGNNTTDFFNAYRKSLSPISRTKEFNIKGAEKNGMNFSFPLIENQMDSASRGVYANDVINALEKIVVRQIFAHGKRMCEYTFNNPRIIRFDFDEMNHETGEGNGLTAQFDYDSLHVSEVITPTGTPMPMWGATDIIGNTPGSGNENVSTADKISGTIMDTVINAGSRMAGTAVSSAIRNATKNIPFVGGMLSGFAGATANKVVTSVIRNNLRSAVVGINNSIAKPEEPPVSSPNNTNEQSSVYIPPDP
jgi:hypothetical protein